MIFLTHIELASFIIILSFNFVVEQDKTTSLFYLKLFLFDKLF